MSSVSWVAVVREARGRFGIKAFRSAQREVLEAVFAGRDTLAMMPTRGEESDVSASGGVSGEAGGGGPADCVDAGPAGEGF